MYHKLYSTMRLILRPSTARPLHVTRPSPSLDPISLPSWWPLITQTKASSAAHIVSSHEWHWSAESDADEVKHSVTFTAEASSDSGSDGKGRWKCRVTLVGPGEGEQLISEATAGSYAEAREK